MISIGFKVSIDSYIHLGDVFFFANAIKYNTIIVVTECVN